MNKHNRGPLKAVWSVEIPMLYEVSHWTWRLPQWALASNLLPPSNAFISGHICVPRSGFLGKEYMKRQERLCHLSLICLPDYSANQHWDKEYKMCLFSYTRWHWISCCFLLWPIWQNYSSLGSLSANQGLDMLRVVCCFLFFLNIALVKAQLWPPACRAPASVLSLKLRSELSIVLPWKAKQI